MEVQNVYDEVAHRYESLIESTQYIGPKWLDSLLSNNKIDYVNVIDLGCATGVLGDVIKKHQPEANIIGFDISSEMLKEASKKTVYSQLFQQNLEDEFFTKLPNKADLIVALGFSEFLSDLDSIFHQMSISLSDNGSLLISFQCYDPNDSKLPRNTRSGTVVHTAYTEGEIKGYLSRHGFHVKSLERTTGYTSSFGYECVYLMAWAQKMPLFDRNKGI